MISCLRARIFRAARPDSPSAAVYCHVNTVSTERNLPSTDSSPTATDSSPRPSAAALEPFVAEHYPRLIRLAALVARSVDEAEDAVQAALERAWRNRASLQDEAHLRPWLDRIVVREAARLARARRPHIQLIDATEGSRGGHSDDRVALRTAFAELSIDQRASVVLHLYLGYTVSETAELLGIPVETVRSRLRVARDRLRHLLAEEG